MKRETISDWRVTITGIVAIVIIIIVAMCLDIDGTLQAAALAIIAGLAGWAVPKRSK